ncbi:retrovirus-related pol polyprotein from transposon TNT 1-94 [Tanacetum coccineum]
MRETHVDLQSQGNYTLFRETMALPAQNINHSAFRSMFDNEKLSGTNFNDCLYLPPAPISEPNVVAEWTKQYDAHTEIACLMLGSMTPELHRQFELYYPYDMIQELRSMFEKQAGVEKFDLIQSFHACKQEEGKPVADYVLKMKGYVEKLERLGYVLPQDITVGLILNGLTKDFAGFVSNYKMHNMGKTIGEIHAMLMEYEKSLPKKAETPQVMMIKKGKIQKANKKSLKVKGKVIGKGKDKKVYVPKPTNPKPIAKERPAKDDACHHCKEVGHWKRNCPPSVTTTTTISYITAPIGNLSKRSTPDLFTRSTDRHELHCQYGLLSHNKPSFQSQQNHKRMNNVVVDHSLYQQIGQSRCVVLFLDIVLITAVVGCNWINGGMRRGGCGGGGEMLLDCVISQYHMLNSFESLFEQKFMPAEGWTRMVSLIVHPSSKIQEAVEMFKKTYRCRDVADGGGGGD